MAIRQAWRQTLDVAATIAVLITCGYVVLERLPGDRGQRSQPVPKSPISVLGAPTEGQASAPVVLMVYSDFECPYCAAFAQNTLPEFRKEYVQTGRVLLAFRHLPLLSIHPEAESAATAAACAAEQSEFWPFHDSLFARGSTPLKTAIDSAAKALHLNAEIYQQCLLASGQATVVRDLKTAKDLGFRVTPTLVVGRRTSTDTFAAVGILEGAVPKAQLDGMVAAASSR